MWLIVGTFASALVAGGIAWYYKHLADSARAETAQAQAGTLVATAAANQAQADVAAARNALAGRQAQEHTQDANDAAKVGHDPVLAGKYLADSLRKDGGSAGGSPKASLPSPNRIRRPFLVTGFGRSLGDPNP